MPIRPERAWDHDGLELLLVRYHSYSKTAKHLGVSRQRVQRVAVKLLGPELCRELIAGAHHKYSLCQQCGEAFTPEWPYAARGLCVGCYRPVYYQERKRRMQQQDPALETDWAALSYSIGLSSN